MTTAKLEHVNVTVANLEVAAEWMTAIFGWEVRWQGSSIHEGKSAHIGGADSYVAIYQPPKQPNPAVNSYETLAGLNHIAVVVDDLDAIEARVKKAGFTPGSHADYEPGRRFYFDATDGIEVEVVQYD